MPIKKTNLITFKAQTIVNKCNRLDTLLMMEKELDFNPQYSWLFDEMIDNANEEIKTLAEDLYEYVNHLYWRIVDDEEHPGEKTIEHFYYSENGDTRSILYKRNKRKEKEYEH